MGRKRKPLYDWEKPTKIKYRACDFCGGKLKHELNSQFKHGSDGNAGKRDAWDSRYKCTSCGSVVYDASNTMHSFVPIEDDVF